MTLRVGQTPGDGHTGSTVSIRYQRVGHSRVVAEMPDAGGRVRGSTVRLRLRVAVPSESVAAYSHDFVFTH